MKNSEFRQGIIHCVTEIVKMLRERDKEIISLRERVNQLERGHAVLEDSVEMVNQHTRTTGRLEAPFAIAKEKNLDDLAEKVCVVELKISTLRGDLNLLMDYLRVKPEPAQRKIVKKRITKK